MDVRCWRKTTANKRMVCECSKRSGKTKGVKIRRDRVGIVNGFCVCAGKTHNNVEDGRCKSES